MRRSFSVEANTRQDGKAAEASYARRPARRSRAGRVPRGRASGKRACPTPAAGGTQPPSLRPSFPRCKSNTPFSRLSRPFAQKGQLLLIAALARLASGRPPPPRLTLVGDGEMRGEIEQSIQRHGLEHLVRITGWLSEERVRDEIRSSRALVLPSFAEGLPVVIMEALAMARPVITTHIAGIPELVRHGDNGWLTAASDINQLADAMAESLDTPAERLEEMGRSGRAAVAAAHDSPTELAKLERLFARAVAGGPAPSVKPLTGD